MIVGDDMAVPVDEKAGPLRLHCARGARGVFELVVGIGRTEAELKKVVEHARQLTALELALHQNADNRRADAFHQIGE